MGCIEDALDLPNQPSQLYRVSFPYLHSPILQFQNHHQFHLMTMTSCLHSQLKQEIRRYSCLNCILLIKCIVHVRDLIFERDLTLDLTIFTRQCITIYGEELFQKIHSYIREARSCSVPHGDEASMVAGLKQLTSNTRDCFLIDQIVFLEKQK